MNITQESDYALRIVYFMALSGGTEKFESHVIAEKEGIPLRFLHKIMRKLIPAGIIASIRGVNGGFKLAKNPDQISLFDIIDAIEGPLAINKCLVDAHNCNISRSASCQLHHSLKKIHDETLASLKKTTMADVIKGN